MIRKLPSYCNRLSNGGFYIEIRNQVTFYIFFVINYKLNDKFITKQSPVFAPGQKRHLLFPSNAENFNFKIYNASDNPPTLIKSITILTQESVCYEIRGNVVISQCIRVPC